MKASQLPLLTLSGLLMLAPCDGIEVFVSPRGDNANPGTEAEPFATLRRAREAVRAAKVDGRLAEPAFVRLLPGVHRIGQPLTLTPEDSGTAECPVTYTGHGGKPVVIDGGRKIDGWKREGKAWVADLPEVKAGGWNFRQLFVDGVKYRRARTPNTGFHRVAGCPQGTPKSRHYHDNCDTFEFKPGDIRPDWTNLGDVEVIVYHFWTDSHLPIKSIDTGKNHVTFAHKAGKVFTDDFSTDGARYIVENVFEALDQPGEWYLNRKTGKIYCLPMPGVDLGQAEVVAPVSIAHLVMNGDAAKRRFVEHVRFRNLEFRHTNFLLPKGNSNDRQGSASVSAAIRMKGARECRFEDCVVSNLGTWAFDLQEGCEGNAISRNEIHHVAAGGIRIDGGGHGSHPLTRTRDNEVADNRLHHYGEDFPSAVGILLMNTSGNRVAHNDIHHGWYTGVSIGWQWGYQRSVSRDNVIEFNHIHDIGQGLLSDMGAIYTLGVSPGTVLRNNLIHDVNANHYGGWGIYHDEGSSHILVEDNVVYNTKFAAFNIHFAKEVTVRNNVFALGRLEQLSRSRAEPHVSCFFENNIVYWKDGELLNKNWRDKPYRFYFHPKNESGTREAKETFVMDWNLYFNPGRKAGEIKFNGRSWEEWRKEGKDRHSLYADPMFVDAEKFDFRLKQGSPALELGFRPIDVSRVGPRK
jgi:hypothetical protein